MSSIRTDFEDFCGVLLDQIKQIRERLSCPLCKGTLKMKWPGQNFYVDCPNCTLKE